MATISTPGGTPSVVYNREGTTIDSITAAGSTQGTATAITRYSGWTVVLVDYGGSQTNGVILPSNAEIGDLVEIHVNNGSAGTSNDCKVYPDSGSTIDVIGVVNTAKGSVTSLVFRKILSSTWTILSQ